MIIIGEENDLRKPSIDDKIRELCEAILADATVVSAMGKVEAFFEDDAARDLYASLAQKSEELHHRQHSGDELTEEDITVYNRLRERAFSHPGVQSFTAARAALQDVEDRVVAFVEKTFELGRIPEESEIVRSGGCCGGGGGGGCGCH